MALGHSHPAVPRGVGSDCGLAACYLRGIHGVGLRRVGIGGTGPVV